MLRVSIVDSGLDISGAAIDQEIVFYTEQFSL